MRKILLASAIEGVSRAITNRSAIPVLEGIYLKAEGFNLTLTGYDMEMGITTTIECNVLVPGETVLEAKLLLSMVSRMPAGDVRIELTDEGQAIISGGVAEFEIPAMNASDYPSLPVTGADNTMTIPTSMMRDLIEKTIYAVSQDDKKPAHTANSSSLSRAASPLWRWTATVWPSSSGTWNAPGISASSFPPKPCRNS